MAEPVSDANWLAFNLDPKISTIKLPALPDPQTQIRFTGQAGRPNLQQAFDFYNFVSNHLPPDSGAQYRIVDFGGGWGRVLRFFLRDVAPERLALSDCLTDAIECARSLNPPYKIFQNDVNPPLVFADNSVDAFVAFSVFSHLNEKSARSWLADFARSLVGGGKVVITTRGPHHIKRMRELQNETTLATLRSLAKKVLGKQNVSDQHLRVALPSADIIKDRLNLGEFQFYPTGGGGELSESFYGETWIPEKWMRDNCQALGFKTYEHFPEFSTVDQCVFVLTK